MTEHLLIGLGSIIVLGVTAQWLAWKFHLPAILLLLIFGVIAGPISGILNPDEVFGDLLFPLVSVSVAIILFEGGLSLRINELRKAGRAIFNLVTVGVLGTWVFAAVAVHVVVGLAPAQATLLGAILVVSGPTVIIPLLQQIRPVGRVGSIIKWEGIVNDPVGAILAVLVFEVIALGGMAEGVSIIIPAVVRALFLGGLIGLAGAGLIVLILKRWLVPDFLQSPVALMVVVACYIAANAVQMESGLLAVTVMGVALTNQRFISIKHITEFKENLRVLLISSLFIILAARMPVTGTVLTDASGWIFVGLLILVVRPVVVFLSTIRSDLRWQERVFLSWMAPRGIVAAAIVSVFVLRFAEAGFAGSELLVPLTFQVIIGTVAVYGLTAPYVARWLRLAKPNPQGILFAGAHHWAREIAAVLKDEGFQVLVVDSNWENVTQARRTGCRATYASIISEELLHELQLDGIGRLLAVTPNDEVNSLAALRFADLFGRSEVYQLPPPTTADRRARESLPRHLQGRYLFAAAATYGYLASRFRAGAVIKRTPLTEEFDFAAFRGHYGEEALPLFIITEAGALRVVTTESAPSPRPGQTIISVVDEVKMPH